MNSPTAQPSLRQRGFNLIELMIGLAIVAMVLMFLVPSMGTWLQSSKIRSASESILTAMQIARTEAVRRNTPVEVFFSSLSSGGTGVDWQVRCVTGSATCPGSGQTTAYIQERQAAEGSTGLTLTVSTSQTSLVFSGSGRLTPVPAGSITLNIGHSTANSCLVDGGEYRCLRIVVASGGQARMCDPSVSSPNPRAC